MIKLTGIWRNEGKNGEYYTGKLGDAQIKIFPNSYKKTDNQPDLIMYLDESKKKQPEQQQGAQKVEDIPGIEIDDEDSDSLPF